uniref:VTT domain-containing protein n=1 Tax=Hanusia phi TaxID=3032 RepID=A0A7S0ED98_9CRYP
MSPKAMSSPHRRIHVAGSRSLRMETPILNKFSLPPSLPNSLSLSTPSSQRKSGKRPLQRLLFTLALLAASSLWSLPSLATTGAASQTAEGASGIRKFVKFVLHLDTELVAIIAKYGTMTYAILWSIVFAETGLVVTPFLPGDSLLFACGALCAIGSLKLLPVVLTFLTAAIIGDAVNYAIGSVIGLKAFESDSWFLKKKNLEKTQKFYEKYGGKTIVLARFVPIVRTFAPFVAGVGTMKYSSFAFYNVIGAVAWTTLFVGAGFFFGNLPAVKHNFTLVVLGNCGLNLLELCLLDHSSSLLLILNLQASSLSQLFLSSWSF